MIGRAEPLGSRRRPRRHRDTGHMRCRTPRGQRGRHVRTEWQRKPGTTRGSPQRSRTAKASRISRPAVKSRCAGEWGGWGRLSEDGPGQHNPDPSEGPWGGGRPTLHGGASSGRRPGSVRDNRPDAAVHEGRRQTGRQQAKASDSSGRPRLIGQPSSRTGENPPYGMRGGIEETSASFEARSAPRSYPTQGMRRCFGAFAKEIARGLAVRHDHGSQYMSNAFQQELAFLGIESSPAFVRAPEGNGCAERFIRTLKENLLWVRTFDTVEELRQALLD